MANLQEVCAKQGIAIEKFLEFALKNLEASKQEISSLKQEREILVQKIDMQQTLRDTDHQHFQQHLQMDEIMHKERELTHAYEMAKSDLIHGARQKDAILLKLRLDYALDDIEELQMRYEFSMLELKEEQAKAQALNRCLGEKETEPLIDQSQIILEVEQRTRSLRESLVKMEKDHCNEIAKVKSERKRISSLWKHEVSALLREGDFVWNQLKRMEIDYADRLKRKNEQLQVASESIENLRLAMDELQQENNEKNVDLTVLKVELGEKEREAQMLKKNDDKSSKATDSLQELRHAMQILTESKEKEKKVVSLKDTCEAETNKESAELNVVYQTCSQEINTKPGTQSEKDNIYWENENKLRSTVFMNENDKQEKILVLLQLEPENAQLKDKEVPDKDSATSRNLTCCGLNTEIDKPSGCSNLVTQPPENEPLLKFRDKQKRLQESPYADNSKVGDGMAVIQYPVGRHEKAALECDGNDSFKNSNPTREMIIKSSSTNNSRRDLEKSISLVKSSSQSASLKKRKQSHELRQNFGENLHPARANFFPSSFCVPKVKGILSFR